jgi:hypothetical protein
MLDKTIVRPIIIIGGGWIAVWMIAVLVAQSFTAPDESINALRISWIVIGLLTGFALYRLAPAVQKYALFIAIGWPLCLIAAAAISPSNIAMVAAVAACGLLAAWALTPLMPSISWLQRLGIAGVWAGCWVISNSIWSAALAFINSNPISLAMITLGRFFMFVNMTSGAILSGVLGSIVLYLLIDQARRKSSRSVASSEGDPQ